MNITKYGMDEHYGFFFLIEKGCKYKGVEIIIGCVMKIEDVTDNENDVATNKLSSATCYPHRFKCPCGPDAPWEFANYFDNSLYFDHGSDQLKKFPTQKFFYKK